MLYIAVEYNTEMPPGSPESYYLDNTLTVFEPAAWLYAGLLETQQPDFLDGFAHAFCFPGLIRVKQSAGRVIRGEQDRGVVVLLDQRFPQSADAQYLPVQWSLVYGKDPDSLELSLTEFWHGIKKTDVSG